jgi:hypothetical protein
VNVAVSAAALRHAVASEADEAEGKPVLLLDTVALASALGDAADVGGEPDED